MGLLDEGFVGVDIVMYKRIVDMKDVYAHLLKVYAKDGVLIAILVAILGEWSSKEYAALDEQIDGAEILIWMLPTIVELALLDGSKLITIA